MRKKVRILSLLSLGVMASLLPIIRLGYQQDRIFNLVDLQSAVHSQESFTVVAKSAERQWTGVAISDSSEILVNFPKWVEGEQFGDSVAKLVSGEPVPFPNKTWNQF